MQRRRDNLSFGGLPTVEASLQKLQRGDLATGAARNVPCKLNTGIALTSKSPGQRTRRATDAARKGRQVEFVFSEIFA